MTATVSDFIRAGGFSLRDAVALDDASLNITNPKVDVVPSPPVLPQGLRFSVADGTHTDYYRVGVNITGSLIAGGIDWVGVDIHPKAVRAYASGLAVKFHPFVSPKGFAPTITVKAHESTSINLLDYFEMVGGKDSDLSFIARPGGAEAQLAVSGSSLTVAGRTPGTMTASISAHDKAQGVATRTFSFMVLPANRAPKSDRAIGNPSVGVGATLTFDLDTYFSDLDGDALTYKVTGATSRTAAAAAISGSELTIDGHSTGSTTLVITASDGTLDISQQVHVTVPPNRRPVRVAHVEPVALNLGGATVTRDIADAFSDPDGGTLSWLVQFEEGDPALQFKQEFWHVVTKQGSNLLNLESLFQYPGTTPPWGATGTPWVIPAGTDFAFRNGSPSVLTRGTLLSTATVRWDAGAGRVMVAIRTTDALPAAAIAPPSRLLLGPQADVTWVEGDQTHDGLVNFIPGESPGSRTGYIKVWDAGGLFASDLFNIALGRGPVAAPIPDQTMFTGAGVTIPLAAYFTDADGDDLAYTVEVSAPHYVTATLVYRQTSGLPGATYAPHSSWFAVDLRLHGVTAGDVTVGITASDKIGLEVQGTIAVTIEASASVGRAPLISRERVHETIARHGQPVVLVGGATGAAYSFLAQVDAGGVTLGTSSLGIGVTVSGDTPVHLTLSDVDFQSVASERDLALLSVNELGTVRWISARFSAAKGFFLFQGERWLIVGDELQIDAGHLLAHRFTLKQDALPTVPTPPPTVPTLAVVSATETASHEAGAQAATVDVSSWFTAANVVPTYALSAAPSWITLAGSTLTIAPPSDVTAQDYTAVVTASAIGVRDAVVTLTATVTAVVVPTLAVVSATETASHEAGATAATVDVSSWFTAANVVPTYALSSAPSWITLAGSTLTIAPPSDVTAQDYTAVVTASAIGVRDAVVTLTATVTAVPGSPWTIRSLGDGATYTPYGSRDMRVYAGTPQTDVSTTWDYPASILAATAMRATIDGTTYIWWTNRRGIRPLEQGSDGVYRRRFSWRSDEVLPSRPPRDAVWTVGQTLEFLDSTGGSQGQGNVITDGPVSL